MTEQRHWADDPWWQNEEHARFYQSQVSSDEISRAIHRVTVVFDKKWQRETQSHPAYQCLLPTGLMPLQFLYSLGKNLLELDGLPRLRSVISDLRNPIGYESALLEIAVAAEFKRSGRVIELHPKLPNGKSSDFLVHAGGQTVYFEIKRLRESDRQLAISELGNVLASMVIALTNSPAHPRIQGKHYEVLVDANVFFNLGKSREADLKTIEHVRQGIFQEIIRRSEDDLPLHFSTPSVGSVTISDELQEGSSILYPLASSDMELERILKNHFMGAVGQLHPKHAGILIVQTPAGLESERCEQIIVDLFARLGREASHMSAAMFLPVYNGLPQIWSLFKPFLVLNRNANFPVESLAVFSDLRAFLDVSVKTPADWEGD